MLMPNSLGVEMTVEVTPDECDTLFKRGVYTTHSLARVEGVSMDTLTNFQVADVGTTNKDGGCSGVTLIHDGNTYTNAVRVSHYKILITEEKGNPDDIIGDEYTAEQLEGDLNAIGPHLERLFEKYPKYTGKIDWEKFEIGDWKTKMNPLIPPGTKL